MKFTSFTSCIFALLIILLLAGLNQSLFAGNASSTKKVLIVVEGSSELSNFAMANGRKLVNLMGHFNTSSVVKGMNEYNTGEMNKYDFTFYVGFHAKNLPPQKFVDDLLKTKKQVIWINSGLAEVCAKNENFARNFGFKVSEFDTTTIFNLVKAGNKIFGKGATYLNITSVLDRKKAQVMATAVSANKQKELPYAIHAKNLYFFADSPLDMVNLGSDRYLYFSDLLHDILGEQHETSHTAVLRIEDVNAMSDPVKLREIADILSDKNIPFLVGVIPFYVDPIHGINSSISDKLELVDALKYMVSKGASIVMHGSTHQYKANTGNDYEFWDGATDHPIKEESEQSITKKLDDGIQEFMKNGLYPVLWETPHYAGSMKFYNVIPNYFSAAIETRLTIDDIYCGQYFPYVINRDLYGQKIYPENLGYIPLDNSMDVENGYVQNIVDAAKANLVVRDGFASCFFHPFVNLNLLKAIVDKISGLGYTYLDFRNEHLWTRTKSRAILTGSQPLTLNIDQQYLIEEYIGTNGEVISKTYSPQRVNGQFKKNVELQPGQMYIAEPTEMKEHKIGQWQNIVDQAKKLYTSVFPPKVTWKEPRVCIFWDRNAYGAAFNDQASMASIFKVVNINVDTIFTGDKFNLSTYRLVLLPYEAANALSDQDYAVILKFINDGGDLMTDGQNNILEDLGIKLSDSHIRVGKIRDKYFPEQDIQWRNSEVIAKFDLDNYEELFCTEETYGSPIVCGKAFGKGKVLYFAARFDPYSEIGISNFPFAMEYVRRYFNIQPLFRRENLEMYFDPGFRNAYPTEDLIKLWVNEGIRIIHVAGWHQYEKYTYDYKRLLELAHANGILVYAWLEPPQVSQKFWMDHPQWREKNYLGKDVRPSWRYPMAMTDASCLEVMITEYRNLLDKYEWDGVNLAEVYFEAGEGLNAPELFTPMHSSAQTLFKNKFGYDLTSIFNASSKNYWANSAQAKSNVIEFRVDQLSAIYTKLLSVFSFYVQKRNGFQMIVTALDNLGSPELREYIGTDIKRIIGLNKQFQFTLQIEDPEKRWSEDPYRYARISSQYRELLGNKFMLDLNILSFRKPDAVTPFPTLIQTGTECFHVVRAAALNSRFTIYAESSINQQDLFYLPYANSAALQYRDTTNGYIVETPYSVFLKLPDEKHDVKIDGNFVAASRDNHFLIPAGHHFIEVGIKASDAFSSHDLQTRIMSITANVLSVAYDVSNVRFTYESDTRTLASFDREPVRITIDGYDYVTEVMRGNDCYTVYLPAGHHDAQIIASNKFSDGVSLLSLWSSTGIALFGIFSVTSLFLMYLALKIVRRRLAVQ